MPIKEAQQFKQIQLTEQAKQINHQLCELIAQKITANQGVISFADYMQLTLYAPQLGYYQNGLQSFGAQGDFITAPEMGDLFAAGLVSCILSVASKNRQNLLEIGAGTGQLASDVLSQLNATQQAPEHYYILEPSSSLQSLQQQTIQKNCPDLVARVIWLNELPKNFAGIIFANEVIDAIPCERIQRKADSWIQLGVKLKSRTAAKIEFEYCELGADSLAEIGSTPLNRDQLPAALTQQSYAEGYTSETRSLVTPWIKSLANCLSEGLILLFDYGYPQGEFYHPQRIDGSLRCFSRHQANNSPLELTGLQDITAHVDFTQVAQAAVDNHLDVEGFTSQAGFLLENGILERVSALTSELTTESTNNHSQPASANRYSLSQQVQKLTNPGQMGEAVKVIGLSKNLSETAKGFSLQDQLHRL